MPLKALINNQQYISSFLSEAEWKQLKLDVKKYKYDVIISQTHKEGYLRKSKTGLQHFVHKNGQKPASWKSECPQHLKAKDQILKGCKEANWQCSPEYAKDNWIADVFAWKHNFEDNKGIAFEVQWSYQTGAETIRRQSNLKKDNVRGCWFFKRFPKEFVDYDKQLTMTSDVPCFLIKERSDKQIVVLLNDREFELQYFIQLLLSGKVQHRKTCSGISQQSLTVHLINTYCWKCSASQYVYYIDDEVQSVCGRTIYDTHNQITFSKETFTAIREYAQENKIPNFQIGPIKKRYSKTVRDSYMSFGCYKCDAIFGSHYIHEMKIEGKWNRRNTIDFTTIIDNSLFKYNFPVNHWCFSDNGHCTDFEIVD